MKDFSMYEQALALAAQRNRTIELGDVHNISRREFDEHQTLRFRAPVPCLEYVSLLIENALLLQTNRTGRVYAAFEKFSRMQAIVDRYLRIADVSERVYVFGEDDWRPPRHPHMRLIPVASEAKMAREWFVIADSPTLRVVLVARDDDGFEMPVLEARMFSAFKSSDAAIVAELAAHAEELIDSTLAV